MGPGAETPGMRSFPGWLQAASQNAAGSGAESQVVAAQQDAEQQQGAEVNEIGFHSQAFRIDKRDLVPGDEVSFCEVGVGWRSSVR